MNPASAYQDKIALKDAFVFLDDSVTPAPRFYKTPLQIIRADTPKQVEAAFTALAAAHKAGHHLAGYISYDLGLWLEPKLAHHLPKNRSHPLICFGVFDGYDSHAPAELLYTSKASNITLRPKWSEADYLKRFDQVQAYLRSGDCYQINLTFPMTGTYDGEPLQLYAGLRHRQKAKYGGFIRLGSVDLLSLSPELFFRKNGTAMTMRPMKGTLKRHPDNVADMALRSAMAQDEKSRAENLMIVDLLRNDLSRLSKPGSVNVPELFSLETYPTLHQMTSRVTSGLYEGVSFRSLFKSLFPCGSVTGAPKIRAMEIIDEIETVPRGAYCGAMGYVDPGGDACFNVGIRTLSLSKGRADYHVGSGVVLDSDGPAEYAECLLKANVLQAPETHFIETFYWDSSCVSRHIGYHLARLSHAVQNPRLMQDVTAALAAYSPAHNPARVKLTISESGKIIITDSAYAAIDTPLRLSLSKYDLGPQVQIMDHKVSQRDFYDGERMRLMAEQGCDEVIFLNANGALCEGSFTSLFIKKDGRLLTPPLAVGILPGVLRNVLLACGDAEERRLTLDDLITADAVYMGNSLRGLMPASLLSVKRV